MNPVLYIRKLLRMHCGNIAIDDDSFIKAYDYCAERGIAVTGMALYKSTYGIIDELLGLFNGKLWFADGLFKVVVESTPKFKVGDEVRVTKTSKHQWFNLIGKTFIISEEPKADRDGTVYYENNKGALGYRWAEDQLELVCDAKILSDYQNLLAIQESKLRSQSELLDQRQKYLDIYHGIVESQEAEIQRLTKIIKDSIETLRTLG